MTDSQSVGTPFQQPFLELIVKGDQVKDLFDTPMFLVDVDGKCELYADHDYTPTPLFIELCGKLAKAGIVVVEFKFYSGSAGPHFILRNGVMFSRVSLIERPDPDVLAYEPRVPKYIGRKT